MLPASKCTLLLASVSRQSRPATLRLFTRLSVFLSWLTDRLLPAPMASLQDSSLNTTSCAAC